MNRFVIALRVVTPAFIRGRDEQTPELRAPSFKGLLRWWYRAWNPHAFVLESPWAEGQVMGGTREGEGQCPFILRVEIDRTPEMLTWEDIRRTANRGSRQNPGGLKYLGFSLGMGKGKAQLNRAIAPATRFKVVHGFPREPTPEQAQAIVGAWWLLAHLGGVGARSRRGFGSLALEGWDWPEQRESLLERLPLPARASSRAEWARKTIQGLEELERWVPSPGPRWPETAPHLGKGSRIVLLSTRFQTWRPAMESAGQILAKLRRESRGRGPVDARVTFGLPLTTGRWPKREWSPGSFRREPIDSDRHASPLHLHIGAWEAGLGQCWSLLAGPRPGQGAYRVAETREGREYEHKTTTDDAVMRFAAALSGATWEGKR